MVEKGDIVEVKAVVYTTYEVLDGEVIHRPKPQPWDGDKVRYKYLVRHKLNSPREGIVIGTRLRATGRYCTSSYGYGYDDDPPYLHQDKRHTVIVVEPLAGERFVKPWECLESDLVVVFSLQEGLE